MALVLEIKRVRWKVSLERRADAFESFQEIFNDELLPSFVAIKIMNFTIRGKRKGPKPSWEVFLLCCFICITLELRFDWGDWRGIFNSFVNNYPDCDADRPFLPFFDSSLMENPFPLLLISISHFQFNCLFVSWIFFCLSFIASYTSSSQSNYILINDFSIVLMWGEVESLLSRSIELPFSNKVAASRTEGERMAKEFEREIQKRN